VRSSDPPDYFCKHLRSTGIKADYRHDFNTKNINNQLLLIFLFHFGENKGIFPYQASGG